MSVLERNKSTDTPIEETPEAKKKREKAERKKASLRAAVGDYEQLDDKAKESIIRYWYDMFQKEFIPDYRYANAIQTPSIKSLLEEYGEKNMPTIFTTIKVLYGEMFRRETGTYKGVYYHYNDVIKSCLGLSQGQLNVITPELLKRMKEIIDAPGDNHVHIIPLTTLFEQGNRLYNSVVRDPNATDDDKEPAM